MNKKLNAALFLFFNFILLSAYGQNCDVPVGTPVDNGDGTCTI